MPEAYQRLPEIKSLGEEAEFTEEDLIIAEDAHVLVTRDGWIKRQKEIKDPAQTRLREGDAVLAVVAGSTRALAGPARKAGRTTIASRWNAAAIRGSYRLTETLCFGFTVSAQSARRVGRRDASRARPRSSSTMLS